MNLHDRLVRWRIRDCTKHDLNPNPHQYAEDKINELSNYELLREISHALEDISDEG